MVQAYIEGHCSAELETMDLNLPPGVLAKAMKKGNLNASIHEHEVLRVVTLQI